MPAQGICKADLSFLLTDLCSQLERAQSSSPIRSQPKNSFHQNLAAAAKPKTRPIKALALSSVRTSTTSKIEKRRRRVTDAAQSVKPVLLPAPEFSGVPSSDTCPRKPLRIPAIVVRPASPIFSRTKNTTLIPSSHSGLASCAQCPALGPRPEPAASPQDVHLLQLETELIRTKADLDTILSKYLHPKLSTLPYSILNELMRFLANSICRLGDTGDQARTHLLPDFCSQLFRHIVTGIFHLLDDVRAPYATAHSAAQLCLALSQELHTYVSHSDRGHKTGIADWVQSEVKFGTVLIHELKQILEEGVKLSNKHNRLALPGSVAPQPKSSSVETRMQRSKLQNQLARQGQIEDAFVGVDVVRFIGEAFIINLVSYKELAAWLDRFLIHTIHPTIPSAWEIECACALLITVGETIDHVADIEVKDGGRALLDPWMRRVDFLVLHGDISDVARDWLIQLQKLRIRKWKLTEMHSDV